MDPAGCLLIAESLCTTHNFCETRFSLHFMYSIRNVKQIKAFFTWNIAVASDFILSDVVLY